MNANITPESSCAIYGDIALSQSYRILGLGDRESQSLSYGCFDRCYWHYRQTDFVNARFQEASQFLALLHNYPHPQNRFYQQPKIYEWAAQAVQFWTKIQRRDGSFDEYWPYERSFCVTSFTLYAAAETCRLLKCPAPKDSMHKAANWLLARDNPIVMNQMAASAVALRIAGELLENEAILKGAEKRIHFILSHQHPTGYFEEYGGADIGYQTISLSCLAQYYLHTRDADVLEGARRGFRFLDDKIDEKGSYDFQNTSRRTQYFYPFGFRVFEEWDLLGRHKNGLQKNEAINPSWFDDRYCLPLAIDYLQTAVFDADITCYPTPTEVKEK
ncbi:MAG: hypothetical protein JXR73_14605 [Candidatus Omnitrophica bacterium]|nr:hypothetical protein [Candidatus Omnitrophota bacterium]